MNKTFRRTLFAFPVALTMVFGLSIATPSQAQAAPSLACYVDTPAFDQFTTNGCFGIIFFGPTTTTAVFKVFGVGNGSGYSFDWSESGCGDSVSCFTTVRAYVPKTVDVIVTEDSTGQQYTLDATAIYEQGF